MSAYTVAALIVTRTSDAILAQGLAVAAALGIDTTSWRAGDPTRSSYKFLAEALSTNDAVVAEYIKAGFLSAASGAWLRILAVDVYGVTPIEATPATSQVLIRNNGGGTYPIGARDIAFKSSLSGKTYHNISAAVTLAPGVQVLLDVVADEPGSGSSAGPNEINTLVTGMLGCVVLSSTAGVGLDTESDASIKSRCTSSLGALSANGPADAYNAVALNPLLTKVLDVARARTDPNTSTLTVTVYVASPTGPVAGASVTAVQAAIESWATPLCVTPTVVNAIATVINFVGTASGVSLPGDMQTRATVALTALLQSLPIGIGAGYDIDPTTITTAVRNAVPQINLLPSYTPNTLVHIAAGRVPTIGTVTLTEV